MKLISNFILKHVAEHVLHFNRAHLHLPYLVLVFRFNLISHLTTCRHNLQSRFASDLRCLVLIVFPLFPHCLLLDHTHPLLFLSLFVP